MEDDLGDKVIYQLFQAKIMSRITWNISLNISFISYISYIWKYVKIYVLKPEIVIFSGLLVAIIIYLQSVNFWTQNLINKCHYSIFKKCNLKRYPLSFYSSPDLEKKSWEGKSGTVAAYAIQGRRPKMEDKFVINENINDTGISLYAIFDGHGGDFAANYAKEKLIQNFHNKVVEIKSLHKRQDIELFKTSDNDDVPVSPKLNKQKITKSLTTDEAIVGVKEIEDVELLNKLNNLSRPLTREVKKIKQEKIKSKPLATYINKDGNIDFGKLLTDEVLAADQLLIETAKKNMNVAGTTALIVVLEGTKLIVANVGDSRGVMCDSKGNAIPLSFDHKPQLMREKKRIKEAGGFVTFNGVWRVAGILATSRALGDYPLKDKKFVIADPDILTFELKDHKPLFVILASDGLWDTFTNEEAVSFIKDRLHETDYGAKSITMQSYSRGSLDNITVLVINFENYKFNLQM